MSKKPSTKLAITTAPSSYTLRHHEKKKIIPFTVTFTPENTCSQKILYEASSFLRNTPANKKFLEYRRMIAYRRSPNLHDLLVFLEYPKPQKKTGCHPCMLSSCNYCKHVTTSQFITSTSTGKRWPIIGHNSCESFHVIYVITCPLCLFQYVGQTGRNIRRRLYEHLRDICTHDRLQPVANLFLDHDVLQDDLLITKLPTQCQRQEFSPPLGRSLDQNT